MGIFTPLKKFFAWLDVITGWYPPEMSMEERNLVRKIDIMVLGYCCLAFFTKYLDISALSNAYISGMKDDLDLYGNRLNYVNAVYQVGYCMFQIPSNIIITRLPSQYYLPTAEVMWGLFTLGTAFVKNYNQLLALRFFVGFSATCCYVGCLHIVNCWYKKVELGRRNAIYFSAMPLGTMIAGYIQGGLTNVHSGGLKPWQWLFVVCAIITIPVAVFGYFFFPDVPEKTTSRWFTEREKKLAFERLQGDGFERSKGLSLKLVGRVMKAWQFWTFVWMGNLFWLAPYGGVAGTPFQLWLQSLSKYPGVAKYSTQMVNDLGTVTSVVSIPAALLSAIYSDWRRSRWEMMLFAGILMLVGNVILVVWDVSFSALFAAFMLLGISNGPANLVVVWAAETFAHDLEARAITLATINATNCALYLVIPLGAWQIQDAPRFFAGYTTSLVMSAVQLVLIPVAVFFQRRDEKKFRELAIMVGIDPLAGSSEASVEIDREIKKHGGELVVTNSVEIPTSIAGAYPIEHESEYIFQHQMELASLEKGLK
ncbi:major facilitator superfamily domain-containing protein [Lipomyces kononenkoae]|uniref:Major facilitator superfamily domain-containing protein n=1 Tax=Lipomyces kononenkoae TaxID=34357 RepID=A0ACC3T4D9_LIPKO